MEPVNLITAKPGDRVLVPWGLGEVPGTVLSLLGPVGSQIARVEIELSGDDDRLTPEVLSLPVDVLKRPDTTRATPLPRSKTRRKETSHSRG